MSVWETKHGVKYYPRVTGHVVQLGTVARVSLLTSSSAMADRPCDCLRQRSPLCSCQHCHWFCARRDAIGIRRARPQK